MDSFFPLLVLLVYVDNFSVCYTKAMLVLDLPKRLTLAIKGKGGRATCIVWSFCHFARVYGNVTMSKTSWKLSDWSLSLLFSFLFLFKKIYLNLMSKKNYLNQYPIHK